MLGCDDMKYLVFLFAFFIFAENAKADYFQVAVKYSCDKANDTLSLKYVGAWNSEGDKLIQELGPDDWDPWNLYVKNKDDGFMHATTAERTCTLSSGAYHITVRPSPEIWTAQGECGGDYSAWAMIKKDTNILFRSTFQEWCHGSYPVIREVRIHGSNGIVEIEQVSDEEFYKD